MKKVKSDYQGVYYREHKSRMHGKAPDKYLILKHSVDGRQIEEGLGWTSKKWDEVQPDGSVKKANWSPKRAAELLAQFNKNKRQGKKPRSLSEMRELQTIKEEKFKAERIRAKSEQITVSEFWDNFYLHALKFRIPKHDSHSKEIEHFEKRIRPAFGDLPLKSVTSTEVIRLNNKLTADGLKPATRKYCLGTINRMWKHAASEEHRLVKMADSPAREIVISLGNNQRKRTISNDELRKILDYLKVESPAAHDVTIFCAFTGCRNKEARGLLWEYVNLENGIVLFPETKNNEARTIFLSAPVIEMLKRRQEQYPSDVGRHVFLNNSGKPYASPPFPFATAVKNLKLNDGYSELNKICFHSLRHTAATHAGKKVPVKDMQVLFGWKTPEMVFRYCKGDQGIQRRAMADLAGSLTGKVADISDARENADQAQAAV